MINILIILKPMDLARISTKKESQSLSLGVCHCLEFGKEGEISKKGWEGMQWAQSRASGVCVSEDKYEKCVKETPVAADRSKRSIKKSQL